MRRERVQYLLTLALASALVSGCGAGWLMVTPGPFKAAYAESCAVDYLNKAYGTAGEKSRTLEGSASELSTRGGVLETLSSHHQHLIFVERKGSFTSSGQKPNLVAGAPQQEEIYPYAAVVYDAASGALVSRTLYAEMYRPQ